MTNDGGTLVVADGFRDGERGRGVHVQSAHETQPPTTQAAGEGGHQRALAHYSQVCGNKCDQY